MNYIVFDLEWNQPLRPDLMVREPVVLRGEIIQIGAVKLDENFQMVDVFNLMIRPTFYTCMEPFVSRLTGITTEELDGGTPFPAAIERFREWCGDHFEMIMWGYEDGKVLGDNCFAHGLDAGWIPKIYNLQLIFSNQVSRLEQMISLSRAMTLLDEEAHTAHDALNDAKNTASICQRLDMRRGLADYEKLQGISFRQVDKFLDVIDSKKFYTSRGDAMDDPEMLRFFSGVLKKTLVCTGIVKQNLSKYIAEGRGSDGSIYFVRFEFSRMKDGTFHAMRFVYDYDNEYRAYYAEMRQRKGLRIPPPARKKKKRKRRRR